MLLRFLLILSLAWVVGNAQKRTSLRTVPGNALVSPNSVQVSPENKIVRDRFLELRTILVGGTSGELKGMFGTAVSMNLPSGENGLFSANQASALISTYFDRKKSPDLEFTKLMTLGTAPFATGSVRIVEQGTFVTRQVFVSFSSHEGTWIVTQFNVY